MPCAKQRGHVDGSSRAGRRGARHRPADPPARRRAPTRAGDCAARGARTSRRRPRGARRSVPDAAASPIAARSRFAASRKTSTNSSALDGIVTVQRPGRDAGPLGDGLHRGRRVAAVLEQLAGGMDQAFARGGGGWSGRRTGRARPARRAASVGSCRPRGRQRDAGADTVERRVRARDGSARSRPRSVPNSKNSFAPLASPCWMAHATARSSAAPACDEVLRAPRAPRVRRRRRRGDRSAT